MYSHSTLPVAATTVAAGGALASTGFNFVWYVLGGFALLSAGMALMRLVPRREA